MGDVTEVTVYSEKYGAEGRIVDARNMVSKLFIEYEGKSAEIGLDLNFTTRENYEARAVELMEAYIEQSLQEGEQLRPTKLYYWYPEKCTDENGDYVIMRGRVSGHPRLTDSIFIYTTRVMQQQVDWERGELLVQTRNTLYHCPLEYADLAKLEEHREWIPEYDRIKAAYEGKILYPQIEPGKVLLVLSNFSEYYFHSLYYVKEEGEEPLKYTGWPHVGMFQDSYLIETDDYEVDLRYFPHYQNIEFYSEQTNQCPWYIENVGDVTLYCKTSAGVMKVAPGERKEVCEDNAEEEDVRLAGGDLYPAGLFL